MTLSGRLLPDPLRPDPPRRVRRLAAALALAAAVPVGLPGPAPVGAAPGAAHPAVPRQTAVEPTLSLPAPTGRYPVGTTLLHLVDQSRTDPLAPTPRARELMVRLWYPAAPSRQPLAAYQTPGVASLYAGFLSAATGRTLPADLLAFPTHSRQDAPAAAGHRHPVVLFSPDAAGNAADLTALHEELASRGYLVAAIDHTFDAGVVEFPGGRLEMQNHTAMDDVLRATRVADARFVLDALGALAAGQNPDAEHRALPSGLGRLLDLTRVAGYGHGLGGLTTVETLAQDPRLAAGAVLDSSPLGQVSPDTGLDRPVLLMGDQRRSRADDPDWAAFYDRLRGPRLHLVIGGAGHDDLSDVAVFKATFGPTPFFDTGLITGTRAVAVERAYLVAWLNQALRGRPSPLLRGESPRYPEVDFQP